MKTKKLTHEPLLNSAELKELHIALYKASADDDERAEIAARVLNLHYENERERKL